MIIVTAMLSFTENLQHVTCYPTVLPYPPKGQGQGYPIKSDRTLTLNEQGTGRKKVKPGGLSSLGKRNRSGGWGRHGWKVRLGGCSRIWMPFWGVCLDLLCHARCQRCMSTRLTSSCPFWEENVGLKNGIMVRMREKTSLSLWNMEGVEEVRGGQDMVWFSMEFKRWGQGSCPG